MLSKLQIYRKSLAGCGGVVMYFILSKWDFYFTMIMIFKKFVSTCYCNLRKYNNLKKLKVGHGRGRTPSFFNVIKDGDKYYTEKRFSTGEIAILRLIEKINEAPNGALVLLDEAEMALHPRVQVNLLKYLKDKAQEKDLMVFISTHSPTLIKATKPSQIILLESNANRIIQTETPCYPARAVGRIDYEESNIYDYIFFVEDDMARAVLKSFVLRYMSIAEQHSSALV